MISQEEFYKCTALTDKANLNIGPFYDMVWEDLPSQQKAAAAVFGYTKDAWDSDQLSLKAEKSWEELSEQEMKAARKLGYSIRVWDKE